MSKHISRLSHADRIDASIRGGMLEASAKHSDMVLRPAATLSGFILPWTVVVNPTAQKRIDLRQIRNGCEHNEK